MRRISKALGAGLSAAAAAAAAALVKDGIPNELGGWVVLVGGALAVGIVAGVTTYSVPKNRV
jgi:hypothetical protein